MHRRRLYKKASTIFVPLWIGLALIFYLVSAERTADIREDVSAEQAYACELSRNLIEDDLRSVFADIQRLVSDPRLQIALADAGPPQKKAVQELAYMYTQECAASEVYDQLRVITTAGMELIRVNFNDGHPTVTPSEHLQNKGERYYVKDILALNAGAMYISPFDLNIEHKQIERPYKPVIRVGTPIVDASGTTRGILVLNYLGNQLLNKIAKHAKTANGKTVLLNADGYWLLGETSFDEWGFMLDKPRLSFRHRFPDAWQQLSVRRQGQFETPDGLFTYEPVFPLLNKRAHSTDGAPTADGSSRNHFDEQHYYWFIVSRIPAREWQRLLAGDQERMIVIFLLVSIVFAAGSVFLARASLARQEAAAALRQSNASLEQRVRERTNELEAENASRRIAERDAKQVSKELHSIFEASGDGLMVLNSQCVISRVNPAALAFLQRDDAQVLGKHCKDVLKWEICGTTKCPVMILQHSNSVVHREVEVKQRDGKTASALVTVVAYKDGPGGIGGYVFKPLHQNVWVNFGSGSLPSV